MNQDKSYLLKIIEIKKLPRILAIPKVESYFLALSTLEIDTINRSILYLQSPSSIAL